MNTYFSEMLGLSDDAARESARQSALQAARYLDVPEVVMTRLQTSSPARWLIRAAHYQARKASMHPASRGHNTAWTAVMAYVAPEDYVSVQEAARQAAWSAHWARVWFGAIH